MVRGDKMRLFFFYNDLLMLNSCCKFIPFFFKREQFQMIFTFSVLLLTFCEIKKKLCNNKK